MEEEPFPEAEPLYTAERAGAMLPELRERLTRIRESRQVMLHAAQPIGARGAALGRGGTRGGRSSGDERAASKSLRAEIGWLAERGIVLRDPESGLVDFPGERKDRHVFLCWRLGERAVAFWHETDTGCFSRRPM